MGNLREQDFDLAVKHMAMRGRIIVMAGRDSSPALPVGPFYVKDCSLHGFAMFNAPPDEQRKCAAEINRWMARHRLKPIIGKTMHLAEAAAAHRLQEEQHPSPRRHAGRQNRTYGVVAGCVAGALRNSFSSAAIKSLFARTSAIAAFIES